jgi:O-antigen/teichoic acid export membrane protein
MIHNRFFRNISLNTFQLIINQVFGLAIFYALSKGLDKGVFGQINWSLAVLLTVFAILTFGIDQVMVRKIAAGYNRQSVFSDYLFHVLISGGIFYGLLLLSYFLFPRLLSERIFLLFIGIGKLGIFFSTPFKQLATGLEKFGRLFVMSIVSNIIRGIAILTLLFLHNMSVRNVLITFILGDLSELALCIFIAKPMLPLTYKVRWDRRRHVLLLKESLPQTGVILFTAIMSRFDWILIGLLVSDSKLAEYSFAYKVFEVSTLPLLIIAPIMVPLFTRLNKKSEKLSNLSFFLKWQIILASFTALLLNICWIPIIDSISDGKYGRVNSDTIFLLSISMPLLYFTNYLWTIQFARGNLKFIFKIMAVSFAVNLTGCSILIPLYKNEGAAITYFLTLLIQLILYLQTGTPEMPYIRGYRLLVWPATALVCGFVALTSASQPLTRIIVATGIYGAVVFASKQIRLKDWKILYSLYQ